LWGEREGMMGSEEEDGGNGEEITQTLHAHMNKRKKISFVWKKCRWEKPQKAYT
jgi:hypothetical protein